jgi:predicted ATPase
MLTTLAIANYRSLRELVVPLEKLNLITGANGSGKSNFYRALRLLAETAAGGVVASLAREGGLSGSYWAGPEGNTRRMKSGEIAIEGTRNKQVKRLKLGFAAEDFSYAITLGLPAPSSSAFALDPEVKHECIWAGPAYRPATSLVVREGPVVKLRRDREWDVLDLRISAFDSVFRAVADPTVTPEVFRLREMIRGWRFYDHFRTDSEAPARTAQLGTRTPVLNHDGHDLAAALQTIREIGDAAALDAAVADAFPGASVAIDVHDDGRFALAFQQEGLLRPLGAGELSDGTLRYLLWVAALLSPRPPELMVLNEPETSLHPDLLPALARLIVNASAHTQVWVISHAPRLIDALKANRACNVIELEKELGQTAVRGQGMVDRPAWHWPE